MWNQKDTMDAGRFITHQGGWDEKSALGRYNAVQNSDFRVGGVQYGGRGYSELGFPGDNGYGRGGYHRDIPMDRDRYQMAPPVFGAWPPPGGTAYEDDSSVGRGPPRHANIGYGDGYRDSQSYGEAGDSYRDGLNFREKESFREGGQHFRDRDNFGDHVHERGERYHDSRRPGFEGDDHLYKRPLMKNSREGSWDREYGHPRYEEDYGSDQERDRRDRGVRKVRRRDRERSKERDESAERGRHRDRFYSRSHSPSRSRSVSRSRSGSRSRGHELRSRRSRSSSHGYSRDRRERSYEDAHSSYGEKRRAKDARRHWDSTTVTPSATLVVKGLSQRTVEDDIYQTLAEWGPLRHVRVIKERSTGTSRGFAFVDFPSVDAARKMMDDVGDRGLVVDGRRLFFEYSKPTGNGFSGGAQLDVASTNGSAGVGAAIDWMCLVCGCVNFARRTSCFQCNEPRADDAPPADVSTAMSSASGRKGSEAGPTHVLVVRGLDENVSEEILHYEFSKYAPLKDLRLVRDKFTHTSKGFAFAHFHSVEDATKALEASNGTTLDKNGQLLRVAFAKSIYGPGSSSTSNTQGSNNLAAAAIEAASFSQQYNAVGWAPKEYNPDEAKDVGGTQGGDASTDATAAPQAGFVWDEASGYYYDAASGFYYDGHRGLYYDGNNGIWYTFNQETQQYEVYSGQEGGVTGAQVTSADASGVRLPSSSGKLKEATTIRKAVISAPPSVVPDAKLGIAEAAKAAAAAANASRKKDNKPRKPLLTSSKTKISGVSAMWKQSKEIPPDQGSSASRTEEKAKSLAVKGVAGSATAATTGAGSVTTAAPAVAAVTKKIQGVIHTRQTMNKGASAEEVSAKIGIASSGMGMATVPKKLEGVIHSRDDRAVSMATKRLEGVLHTRDDTTGVGTVKGVLRSREGLLYSSPAMGHSVGNPDYRSSESTLSQVRRSSVLAGQTPSSMHVDLAPKVDGGTMRGGASSATTGGRRRFTEAPQSGRNLG